MRWLAGFIRLKKYSDESVSSSTVSCVKENLQMLRHFTLKYLTLKHMKLEYKTWMTFIVN